MARKKVRIFSFNWLEDGYGAGVMLVAATTREEAIELAKQNSQYWINCTEELSLKFNGKYIEPIVILSSRYQE
jgi:hypothetical protein